MKNSAVIVTFSGMEFDVLNPDSNKILLIDIAHALSQTCRFTGHTSRFYSVAEHSIHCSELVLSFNYQRACLLHDAAEAYLNDIASPVKRFLPAYNKLEENILLSIFCKYGLNLISPGDKLIKLADKYMLRSEIHELMLENSPAFTDIFAEAEMYEELQSVYGWHPEYAEKMFLQRAKKLGLED